MATVEWARVVHPELDDDAALAKLWDELVYTLRLDEDDAAAAWRDRAGQLHDAALKLDGAKLDAIRFEGPGTDLTVGLLPTSRFAGEGPGMTTVDGVNHNPNLPSEEVFTTPDPFRADGVVTATKPLDLNGALVDGLTVRFEAAARCRSMPTRGRRVRSRCAKDEGCPLKVSARRPRTHRKTGTVSSTLLDENAAISRLGTRTRSPSARMTTAASPERIHVDFIRQRRRPVTGLTKDEREVPVLRGGAWRSSALSQGAGVVYPGVGSRRP
jgi:aminopeptidase